jgi:hypothetical protein
VSQLELAARPLRRDVSRLVVPLLILPGLAFALVQVPAAAVLCPLMLGPWLWWRRERFWLDHCRVVVDGPALRVCYRQRQLLALDLRYTARQFTADGDLVLSEGDCSYLALGVDPPEHAYPAPATLPERGHPDPAASGDPAADRAGAQDGQLGSWRAVRLTREDLRRLSAQIAAVPMLPPPDAAEPWALLQALGSVGTTGRRAEELLGRLARADGVKGRPSGLVTTLRERALEPGPSGEAARRVLAAALAPL